MQLCRSPSSIRQPERKTSILVDAATLQAEKLIETCEHCNEEGAEIPFDAILAGAMPPAQYGYPTVSRRLVCCGRAGLAHLQNLVVRSSLFRL